MFAHLGISYSKIITAEQIVYEELRLEFDHIRLKIELFHNHHHFTRQELTTK